MSKNYLTYPCKTINITQGYAENCEAYLYQNNAWVQI